MAEHPLALIRDVTKGWSSSSTMAPLSDEGFARVCLWTPASQTPSAFSERPVSEAHGQTLRERGAIVGLSGTGEDDHLCDIPDQSRAPPSPEEVEMAEHPLALIRDVTKGWSSSSTMAPLSDEGFARVCLWTPASSTPSAFSRQRPVSEAHTGKPSFAKEVP